MAKEKNCLAEGGMRFFGKMSAVATHEIKNTLAIINESSGLLSDLSVMAEKGYPLSSVRINDISQRVTRQVKRADRVLRNLNQFSHSVDLSEETIDLEKTICFVLELVARIFDMQGAAIKVVSPSSPVMVCANLFYLENMIYRAIEIACAAAVEKQVTISFGTDSTAPSIWFSMDAVIDRSMDKLFGSKQDRVLIAYLDISVEKNDENNSFGLVWPELNPLGQFKMAKTPTL